ATGERILRSLALPQDDLGSAQDDRGSAQDDRDSAQDDRGSAQDDRGWSSPGMTGLDAIRRDLSVDQAWRHLEHIAGEIPSRLAGSPSSRRMAEYAHDALGRAGLESRLDEFPGLVSFPEEALVRVLSPER